VISQPSKGRPFKKFFCDRDETFLIPANPFKVWMFHYRLEGKERRSWPSREIICRKLSISVDTLKRSRKWLIQYGWLERIGERNSEGEFAVPIFRVTRGRIPTVGAETAHGKTAKGGCKNRPRSRVQKASTVAGAKTAQEVDSKSSYIQREVDTAKTTFSPSNPNPTPKPSGTEKQDPRIAFIEKTAWSSNPKAVFTLKHEELLTAILPHLKGCKTKIAEQAIRERVGSMNDAELTRCGELLAEHLVHDVQCIAREIAVQTAGEMGEDQKSGKLSLKKTPATRPAYSAGGSRFIVSTM
jgi:hypothetical protein